MQHIQLLMQALWHDDSGVTAIEYALIASLIVIVILTAVAALGTTLHALWDRIAGCVANPSSCA